MEQSARSALWWGQAAEHHLPSLQRQLPQAGTALPQLSTPGLPKPLWDSLHPYFLNTDPSTPWQEPVRVTVLTDGGFAPSFSRVGVWLRHQQILPTTPAASQENRCAQQMCSQLQGLGCFSSALKEPELHSWNDFVRVFFLSSRVQLLSTSATILESLQSLSERAWKQQPSPCNACNYHITVRLNWNKTQPFILSTAALDIEACSPWQLNQSLSFWCHSTPPPCLTPLISKLDTVEWTGNKLGCDTPITNICSWS